MSENVITIELSRAQIDRVVHEAGKDSALLGLVGAMEGLDFRASPAQIGDPRFSRPLLLGLTVLASFPPGGFSRQVGEVARELDMGVSTTHRYVSTLVEVGLLERDPVSREYRRATSG